MFYECVAIFGKVVGFGVGTDIVDGQGVSYKYDCERRACVNSTSPVEAWLKSVNYIGVVSIYLLKKHGGISLYDAL